ncbi:lytic transglycosylase domain-containing protein [Bradyrhizobium sp. UASWS1016]|uniref:lytic transglycosylase domain-containing protein n=1 Tax=Bradyrhizobium sp. UASWS1016 TaxID=1566379 RepID=UPI001FE1460D|nr:lytic transglycosylase domain-containing protein [Bradyrhizobium sp. UASWS1016]
MGVLRFFSGLSLFDQLHDHFSAPTKACKAGARSDGRGRPNGRHQAALPSTGVSTTTCSIPLAMGAWAVIGLLFIVNASAASAEEGSTIMAIRQVNKPLGAFISEASQRFAIPVLWIDKVLNIESAGDTHARSPKGAMGLMQVMPETWAELRIRYDLGDDLSDPHDNILAGTAYLRELLDRYGSPGVFAAYNAGPSRYEEYLAGGRLPAETLAYVAKLANLLGIALSPTWTAGRESPAAATPFVTPSDLTKMGDLMPVFVPSSGTTAAISSRDILQMVPKTTGVFVARLGSGASR